MEYEINYYEKIIKLDKLLNELDIIENPSEKINFIEDNFIEIYYFSDLLEGIFRQDKFKENEINDILKKNIIRVLNKKDVFEKSYSFQYYKANILDSLSRNENKFAFDLQSENNKENVEMAIKYLKDREEYIKVLEENNFFNGQDMNENSAKEYKNNCYEENMFGHALIFIEKNFANLDKKDILKIVDRIDDLDLIENLSNRKYKENNFYENNLIYQYVNTVVKIKSIFTSDKINEDKIVKGFFYGNISEKKLINQLSKVLSTENIEDVLVDSNLNNNNNFFKDLYTYFSNKNMSDENIDIIMKNILENDNPYFEVSEIIAKTNIPNTYQEFLNSECFEKENWLKEYSVYEAFKNIEQKIEKAEYPFLDVNYYLKKLDEFNSSSNLSENIICNLVKVLNSNYYSDDEKQILQEKLEKQIGLSQIKKEKITFSKKDDFEEINKKAKESIIIGEVIPLDVSLKILNENITNNNEIEKDVLKSCITSVVSNTLKLKEIDIQNRVFFGESDKKDGYYIDNKKNKCIWINECLVDKYLNSKDISGKLELYYTMFHEMRHAEQFNNIENNKIDYQTYNFLKEEIVCKYDKQFYSKNYKSIFIEADARKEQILGTLEFLNDLNPKSIEGIIEKSKEELIKESKYNVINDSKKQMSLGNNNYIDVSDYVGKLINENPEILLENPVLKIEYSADGSRKNIEILQKEFENIDNKYESLENKNKYYIYIGIIDKSNLDLRKKEETLSENENISDKEGDEFVTIEDMKNIYKLVNEDEMNKIYSRINDLICIEDKIENKKGVYGDDTYTR